MKMPNETSFSFLLHMVRAIRVRAVRVRAIRVKTCATRDGAHILLLLECPAVWFVRCTQCSSSFRSTLARDKREQTTWASGERPNRKIHSNGPLTPTREPQHYHITAARPRACHQHPNVQSSQQPNPRADPHTHDQLGDYTRLCHSRWVRLRDSQRYPLPGPLG